MPLELWIPESARDTPEKRVLKCHAPDCGRTFPFTQREAFERHVKRCAKRNIDAIQELTEMQADGITRPSDTEAYSWVRKRASEVGPTKANRALRGSRHGRKT